MASPGGLRRIGERRLFCQVIRGCGDTGMVPHLMEWKAVHVFLLNLPFNLSEPCSRGLRSSGHGGTTSGMVGCRFEFLAFMGNFGVHGLTEQRITVDAGHSWVATNQDASSSTAILGEPGT